MQKNQIYIIDTNVLVDYPAIIPNGKGVEIREATVDFQSGHTVIPSVVIQELSKLKRENSPRGHNAREALNRIRNLIEKGKIKDLRHSNFAAGEISISIPEITISVSEFLECRTNPEFADNDGKIIVLAHEITTKKWGTPVIIVTNDNGLAIRTIGLENIQTTRFGCSLKQQPKTKRLKLKISDDLFDEFKKTGYLLSEKIPGLDLETFSQHRFVEFETDSKDSENYFDYYRVGKIKSGSSIEKLQYAPKVADLAIPKNTGQAIYLESLLDPDIDLIIVTGSAGTGKTFLASIIGWQSCINKKYNRIIVIPSNSENDNRIGALPGGIEEKTDPWTRPIKDALNSFNAENHGIEFKNKRNSEQATASPLNKLDRQAGQIWESWFEIAPLEFLKGRDLAGQFIICDEFQDHTINEADTIIKRLSQGSKMIIAGDIRQLHKPYLNQYNNGLIWAQNMLSGCPRVAIIELENEVVRHEIVRYLAERQH